MKDFLKEHKWEYITALVSLIVFLVIGAVILFMPLDAFQIDDEITFRVLDERFYYEGTDVYDLFANISQSAYQRYKLFVVLDFVIIGACGVGMTALMTPLCNKKSQILAVCLSLLPSAFNFVENVLTIRAMSYFPTYMEKLSEALSAFTTIKWCSLIIWALTFIALFVLKCVKDNKKQVENN